MKYKSITSWIKGSCRWQLLAKAIWSWVTGWECNVPCCIISNPMPVSIGIGRCFPLSQVQVVLFPAKYCTVLFVPLAWPPFFSAIPPIHRCQGCGTEVKPTTGHCLSKLLFWPHCKRQDSLERRKRKCPPIESCLIWPRSLSSWL